VKQIAMKCFKLQEACVTMTGMSPLPETSDHGENVPDEHTNGPISPAGHGEESGGATASAEPADTAEPAGIDAALIDAVRAEVVTVGLPRTTATAVAHRAGISRVTLYRRAGGVERLVLNAITQEMADIITPLRRALPDRSGRDRAIILAFGLMEAFAASPFLNALVVAHRGLLEPYLTEHLGSSQRAMIDAMLPELERGITDGSIAPGEPRVLATVLLHALTPFATAERLLDGEIGRAAVQAQLHRLISGYLAASSEEDPS